MHILSVAKYATNGFVFKQVIPSFTHLVFLFMTISGFGMCCGYYDKFMSGKIDIVSFYRKRYLKILPFFAFLSVIDVILAPSISSVYEAFANVTLVFGLIPNANISVIGVGWFLGVVFAFYFLFPFYCFLLSTKKKAWITFAISCALNYICNAYFGVERESIVFCFCFFVSGGIIYLYRDLIASKRGIRWAALFIMVIMSMVYFSVATKIFIILLFDITAVIFAVSLVGNNLLNNCITKFISGFSLEIYLCHMVIYRAAEKMHLLRMTSNDYINYFFTVVIVFSGAVLVAWGWKAITRVVATWMKR